MSLSTFLNSSFVSVWQTLPGVRAQVRALERAMPQEEEEGNIFLSFTTCSCPTSSTCISFPDMSPGVLTEEWNEVSNVPPVLPLVSLSLLENKGGKVESGRKARLESNEDRQGHSRTKSKAVDCGGAQLLNIPQIVILGFLLLCRKLLILSFGQGNNAVLDRMTPYA